jgi:hypothetical protein
MVLTVNLTVKFFRPSASEFYRQAGFRIARKTANHGDFGRPIRRIWEIIGFSADRDYPLLRVP